MITIYSAHIKLSCENGAAHEEQTVDRRPGIDEAKSE